MTCVCVPLPQSELPWINKGMVFRSGKETGRVKQNGTRVVVLVLVVYVIVVCVCVCVSDQRFG